MAPVETQTIEITTILPLITEQERRIESKIQSIKLLVGYYQSHGMAPRSPPGVTPHHLYDAVAHL